jgi:hypothetical protein
MSVLFTVTINNPPSTFDKKSAEVAYIARLLDTVEKELGRGFGTVTSGTIGTYDISLDSPTAQGSWTYTPVAGNP